MAACGVVGQHAVPWELSEGEAAVAPAVDNEDGVCGVTKSEAPTRDTLVSRDAPSGRGACADILFG